MEISKIIDSISLGEIVSRCRVNEQSDKEWFIDIQGKKILWRLRLFFSFDFPYSLPSVSIENKEFIGSIPHVNYEGVVCLTDGEGILINFSDPKSIVESVIKNSLKLLDKAILGIFKDDLIEEYEGYWECIASKIVTTFSPSETIHKIDVRVINHNVKGKRTLKPFFIKNDSESILNNDSEITKLSKFTKMNGLYLPLREGLLPPPNASLPDSEYIYNLRNYLNDEDLNKLDALIKTMSNSDNYFILIGTLRKNGERGLTFFHLKGNKNSHPLSVKTNEWNISIYHVNRYYKDYLFERGSANKNLNDKTIMVIGCGSVGGSIVNQLSRTGIGEIILVDHDVFTIDNIYRHILGSFGVSFIPSEKTGEVPIFKKVDLMRINIMNSIPYINILTINKPAQSLEFSDFSEVELVIVATGKPSTDLYINKILKSFNIKNVIYSWNEAGSIGGHALYFNLNNSCLNCLYSSSQGFKFQTEFDLIEPGQNSTKNLTGCSGAFTPFTYLDSSQTALFSSKLAVEVLNGNTNSRGLSWKGDNISNLKVTNRYKSMSIFESFSLEKSEFCEICLHGK